MMVLMDPAKLMKNENPLIEEPCELKTDDSKITATCISPHKDKICILLGYANGTIISVDLTDPSNPQADPISSTQQGEITCMAWNNAVQHIVVIGDSTGQIVVFNLQSKSPFCEIGYRDYRPANKIEWDSKGMSLLVSFSQRCGVQLYDIAKSRTENVAQIAPDTVVTDFVWYHKDPSVVIVASKNKLASYHLPSGECLYELPLSGANKSQDMNASFLFGQSMTADEDFQQLSCHPSYNGIVALSSGKKFEMYNINGRGVEVPDYLTMSQKRIARFSFNGSLTMSSFNEKKEPVLIESKVFTPQSPSLADITEVIEFFKSVEAEQDETRKARIMNYIKGKADSLGSINPELSLIWNTLSVLFAKESRLEMTSHLSEIIQDFDKVLEIEEAKEQEEEEEKKPEVLEEILDSKASPSSVDFFSGVAPPQETAASLFGSATPVETPAASSFFSSDIPTAPTTELNEEDEKVEEKEDKEEEMKPETPKVEETEIEVKKTVFPMEVHESFARGKLEHTVSVLFKNNLPDVALFIAKNGENALMDKACEYYAAKAGTFDGMRSEEVCADIRSFVRKADNVFKNNWNNVIAHSSNACWKKMLITLLTYCSHDLFNEFCLRLGDKIASEYPLGSACCYILGNNMDKAMEVISAHPVDPQNTAAHKIDVLTFAVASFFAIEEPTEGLLDKFNTFAVFLAEQGKLELAAEFCQIVRLESGCYPFIINILKEEAHAKAAEEKARQEAEYMKQQEELRQQQEELRQQQEELRQQQEQQRRAQQQQRQQMMATSTAGGMGMNQPMQPMQASRPVTRAAPRPALQSDGFVTTVGNEELARKYGNHPQNAPVPQPQQQWGMQQQQPQQPMTMMHTPAMHHQAHQVPQPMTMGGFASPVSPAIPAPEIPSPAVEEPVAPPAPEPLTPNQEQIINHIQHIVDTLIPQLVSGVEKRQANTFAPMIEVLRIRLSQVDSDVEDIVVSMINAITSKDFHAAQKCIQELSKNYWATEKEWIKTMKTMVSYCSKRLR
eukprot:TRINITY_DN1351_c0_g1_i2.p1 TRINITY_DN1351_c0_g1~~TRINITY_DN1351_c0_g1_i2.p1  ORF type:complete len:1114 (+),score=427.12 TRINITY_DN1351_c0_g1_i2:301-3342(+)